jgi:spore cortex formation protein SpoVR/YcgB (stage V sporulation)
MMHQVSEGDWVKHSDVEELIDTQHKLMVSGEQRGQDKAKQEIKELKAQNEELRTALQSYVSDYYHMSQEHFLITFKQLLKDTQS